MISVSILSEKDNFKEAVNKINKTDANYLHLDIMDNTFTNTISFNIDESIKINELSNKKLDIHLMSNNLDTILENYIKLKPNNISIHYEIGNTLKYINKIKENNIKVGLAINPETKVNEIINYLDKIDIILVMGVTPGEGGQKYKEEVTQKLKELKQLQKDYNYKIEIDGGINNKTIKKVKEYTDIIVSGSYITNSTNYQEKIDELK